MRKKIIKVDFVNHNKTIGNSVGKQLTNTEYMYLKLKNTELV